MWIILALAWGVEGRRHPAEMPVGRQWDQLAMGVVEGFSLAKPQPPSWHRQCLKYAGHPSLFHSIKMYFSFVSSFSPLLSLKSLHFKLFFTIGRTGNFLFPLCCSSFVFILLKVRHLHSYRTPRMWAFGANKQKTTVSFMYLIYPLVSY